MIKDLTKTFETNWNERIYLQLPLADLQIIYDCIGAVPSNYLIRKHEKSRFLADVIDKSKFNDFSARINTLYNELDEIVSRYNGITDMDLSVNTDIELDIIEDTEE